MKVKWSTNRLYKIIIETNEPACLLSKLDESSWLWHSCLRHVNFQAMGLMSTTQMVHVLPKVTQPKDVCTGCLISKQTRKPFPSQESYCAKQVLELVHGDLCGPIWLAMLTENKYFFSFGG